MDFKEAFKFPLKISHGIVFTSENNRAFDFSHSWEKGEIMLVCKETKQDIVDVVNGQNKKINIDDLSHKDSYIYSGTSRLLSIRGWGHLTGTGGLKLSDDVADKLQDDFANYIVKSLTDAMP